jgi:hypothetical protein
MATKINRTRSLDANHRLIWSIREIMSCPSEAAHSNNGGETGRAN